MHSRGWKFRLAALLAVASFGVHQLRFVLAYGAGTTRALAHEGHAYLSIVAPLSLAAGLVVALVMRGAAAVSEAVARHRGVRGPASAPLVQVLPAPARPRTGRVLLRSHAPRAPPVLSA